MSEAPQNLPDAREERVQEIMDQFNVLEREEAWTDAYDKFVVRLIESNGKIVDAERLEQLHKHPTLIEIMTAQEDEQERINAAFKRVVEKLVALEFEWIGRQPDEAVPEAFLKAAQALYPVASDRQQDGIEPEHHAHRR